MNPSLIKKKIGANQLVDVPWIMILTHRIKRIKCEIKTKPIHVDPP